MTATPRPLTVLSIVGTRPEAIKMAPVLRELASRGDAVRSVLCATAQHREMLDQVLELFGLRPDVDLDLMRPGQTISGLAARVLQELPRVLDEVRPDWMLVQGDTTTVMAASLAAFFANVKVGHVEAGLRTRQRRLPFPEELNRRVTAVAADAHFAPTETSRQALLAEAVPDESIVVTGNTVVDALQWAREMVRAHPPKLPDGLDEAIGGRRMVLVTGHRRESFGEGLEQVCLALRDIVSRHPGTSVVYPVHLNPNVREPVYRILGGVRDVHLIEPLPYGAFVFLMDRADFILSDSGGVQEEAPVFGKPLLVMRETTERPEGIASGNARLVGTRRETIVAEAARLIEDPEAHKAMARAHSPYGDGHAARRIADWLIANG